MAGEVYSEGIETVERDGVALRVYSVAKTVADCFKHRNKIGLDAALEALKDVRAKRRASADDLWRVALREALPRRIQLGRIPVSVRGKDERSCAPNEE